MKKYAVTLTKDERDNLKAITTKGSHKSQKVINALILMGCDEGGKHQEERSTNEEIARVLKIDRVKIRFVEHGLEVTLNGVKGSRIYAKKVEGDFEAHLIALNCSDHPMDFLDGRYACWQKRL